jgi:hypothetical protein
LSPCVRLLRPVPAGRSVAVLGRFIIILFVLCLFGILADEIGGMEEGALLRANVDECRLNSRQHCFDLSQVHVANHATVVWTIDEELNQLPVLQNRHARFTRAGVNEDFSFHRRPLGP